MIHALGNPAEAPIAETLDGTNAIHFASLNLFEASAGDRAHLVLELSGDGDADELLRKLDSALAVQLGPVFAHAADWGSGSLSRFWKHHAVDVGPGPVVRIQASISPGRRRCQSIASGARRAWPATWR